MPSADKFVELSFGAVAEAYGNENDWEQKMDGENKFRDVSSNLKVWYEPFSKSTKSGMT